MPTPVEKRLPFFYPLKSGIVKPIAWAAHTSAVGLIGLFSVSVTYSYFTSTYWHAFRVFFNTPHGLGPDSKLKEFLKKLTQRKWQENLNPHWRRKLRSKTKLIKWLRDC